MSFQIDGKTLIKYVEEPGVPNVVIPDGITTIGVRAFTRCMNINSVMLPDGVIEIGDCAFQRCESLENITIPSSVTRIGDYAFSSCIRLKNITIPDSITEIGAYAFEGCTSLKNITIPDSVTEVGWGAFNQCRSIKSVSIPDSVIDIDDGMFEGCDDLTEVDIRNIGTNKDGVTMYCYKLHSVNQLKAAKIKKLQCKKCTPNNTALVLDAQRKWYIQKISPDIFGLYDEKILLMDSGFIFLKGKVVGYLFEDHLFIFEDDSTYRYETWGWKQRGPTYVLRERFSLTKIQIKSSPNNLLSTKEKTDESVRKKLTSKIKSFRFSNYP